jgi:hypothetical protein
MPARRPQRIYRSRGDAFSQVLLRETAVLCQSLTDKLALLAGIGNKVKPADGHPHDIGFFSDEAIVEYQRRESPESTSRDGP